MRTPKVKTINTTKNLSDDQKARILLQVHNRNEAMRQASDAIDEACKAVLFELGVNVEKEFIDLATLTVIPKPKQ